MGFADNDLTDADAIMESVVTLAANDMANAVVVKELAGTDSDIFANVDYIRLKRDDGVASMIYIGILESN
jgi:hypothetical protein